MPECNWCKKDFPAGPKPYCDRCAKKCQKECGRCHRPFPNLSRFESEKSVRCITCQKSYLTEKERRLNKKEGAKRYIEIVDEDESGTDSSSDSSDKSDLDRDDAATTPPPRSPSPPPLTDLAMEIDQSACSPVAPQKRKHHPITLPVKKLSEALASVRNSEEKCEAPQPGRVSKRQSTQAAKISAAAKKFAVKMGLWRQIMEYAAENPQHILGVTISL